MAYFIRKEHIWKDKSQEELKKLQKKERKRVEKYIFHKNYFTNKNSDDEETEKTS